MVRVLVLYEVLNPLKFFSVFLRDPNVNCHLTRQKEFSTQAYRLLSLTLKITYFYLWSKGLETEFSEAYK